MSFEGHYQMLCKDGHYSRFDCYEVMGMEVEVIECRHSDCNEHIVWWNLVDETNGSFDSNGERIDGYVETFVVKDDAQSEDEALRQRLADAWEEDHDHHRQQDMLWKEVRRLRKLLPSTLLLRQTFQIPEGVGHVAQRMA